MISKNADLFALQQTLSQLDVMLCFNGSLTRTIIEELGLAIRKHLEEEAAEKSVVFDVFSIYIEQVQNIRHYAQRTAGATYEEFQRLNNAIIVIKQNGERYTVSSGNLVMHNDVAALAAHIDHIKSLDEKELRRFYKETLKKPRDLVVNGNGGAGLGLISMARLVKEPLYYSMQPIDDTHTFFTLAATL